MYTVQKNSRAWKQHSSCCQLPPCGSQHSSCNSSLPTNNWNAAVKEISLQGGVIECCLPGVLTQIEHCSRKGGCLAAAEGNGHFLILHICFIYGSFIATPPNRGGAEAAYREDKNKALHRVTNSECSAQWQIILRKNIKKSKTLNVLLQQQADDTAQKGCSAW